MVIAVIALSVAVVVLLILLLSLRRGMEEILRELREKLAEDTNTLISVDSSNSAVRRLAAELNTQLRALRSERRKLQSGDKELKEAVTNISHDLRTPLTAICGYLDLLRQEEKSQATSRYIAMIENRIEALKSLTEELFHYSVILSGEEEPGEKLSLNQVLEESLLSFYATLERQGIRPEIEIPEERVERVLSRSALSRVFDNIISNGVKYSDGDFKVTLSPEGTVTFSNTAKGLTAVEAEKLFNRFFTVETGRSSTGLGLSIAKLLTQRMGGTIQAEHHGETLFITLHFP